MHRPNLQDSQVVTAFENGEQASFYMHTSKTYPSVRVLWTLVVVPQAQSAHLDVSREVHLQQVLLSRREWDHPHVFVASRDVRTVNHSDVTTQTGVQT